MPNHSVEHMRRITDASAAKRRADKIARLIDSSPPLARGHVADLIDLLNARVAAGGSR